MKRISSELLDRAHGYMGVWVQTENWDDLAVMLMEGDTELAAHHLVGAGAIDSKRCYLDAIEVEQAIELLAKRFRRLTQKQQSKRYDAVFKGCLIADCQDCNHVSFVHSGNEALYPEVKTACWSCKSTNIEVYRWGEKKKTG